MTSGTQLTGRLSVSIGAAAALVGAAVAQTPATSPDIDPGTPVQLMVVKEVDSRSARAGDRIRLRVDKAVLKDGETVIPVGAPAWGEVVYVNGTGAVGGKGRLTAQLRFIDLPGGRVPITGTHGTEGKSNTAGLAVAVVSFGLLGLLMKGGNAHFKAGDILTAYTADPVDAPAAPLEVTASSTGQR